MTDRENGKETHPLFPSGEWEGFYTYYQGPDADRHPMAFSLDFTADQISGSGGDDVGPFVWEGQYDKVGLRCQLMKYYITHSVRYEGHVDENGIWGTWHIYWMSGGFHIWPKKREEEETAIEVTVEERVKVAE